MAANCGGKRRVRGKANMLNRRYVLGLIPMLILETAFVGCGKSRSSYLPAAGKARESLTTVLNAWKGGTPHGPITSSKPVINVFDLRWTQGKKLESFEIVEEIKKAEQPQFKVRMKLEGEPEQENVFLVIGIDPLQVFRDEDYVRMQSM